MLQERLADTDRLASQPGRIGAVAVTTEVDPPLEMLGERPPYPLNDRHRMYESDFNAICALEVAKGTITWETAEQAMSNFHVYMSSNRFLH